MISSCYRPIKSDRGCRRSGAAPARRAGAPVYRRRQDPQRGGLDRHQRLSERRARLRGAPEERRRGALPREGERQGQLAASSRRRSTRARWSACAWRTSCARALARGELVLHWQPVVRGWPPDRNANPLHWRGRVVGAEALVRWQHPERGLLMPRAVRAARRGMRPDPRGRRVDPGARAVAGRRLAAALRPQALDRGQRLGARAVAGPAYIEKLQTALRGERLDGRQARARGHRARADVRARGERRDPQGDRRARRALRDRRLRHRLLEPRLPAPAADRQAEDRPLVPEHASTRRRPTRRSCARSPRSPPRSASRSPPRAWRTRAQLERLLALGCEEWQGHYFSAPLDTAAFEALLSPTLFSARTARRSEA